MDDGTYQRFRQGAAPGAGPLLPSARARRRAGPRQRLPHRRHGDTASLDDWLTTFQLAVVVIDPYTSESSWLLDTAGQLLTEFIDADCRVAWVVTSDADDARTFLGPWSDQLLTFCDADRSFVRGVGLERLPAFVHLRQDRVVVSAAEGWDPGVGLRHRHAHADDVLVPGRGPPPGAPPPFSGSPA